MKKICSVLLAISLLLGMTGISFAEISGAGVLPISDEPVTIDIFLDVGPSVDLEQNTLLKWIEEQTNVHLNVVERPLSESDSNTTKNLLMASNAYPEMFLMGHPSAFTMAELLQYGVKDGSFIALNDLIDEYGYWVNDIYELHPENKNIMYAPDGNIYGINNASECGHCQAYPKLWVRTDWLEKLNLSTPTTTDELYDMLVAFKTMDPNGNGQADEIPLTADIDETIDAWIMNAFVPYFPKVGQWINGSNYCYADENGNVVFSGTQPAFRDGLSFMNKLYSEGLVDVAAFTQTMEQGKVTVCTEPYPVGAFVAMHYACLGETTNEELYANFHAITPVAGPDGLRLQAYNPSINDNAKAFAVITDNCKNPEAALRFIDFMLKPEVSFLRERGQEGIDWVYAQPGQTNVRGGDYVYELLHLEPDSEEALTAVNRKFSYGPGYGLLELRNLYSPAVDWSILNTDPSKYEARLETETIPLTEYFYPHILPNTLFMEYEDSEEFNELTTMINDYMIKSVAQFVTGDRKVEQDWDTYLSELDRYGLNRMLELYQKAFDNYNRK